MAVCDLCKSDRCATVYERPDRAALPGEAAAPPYRITEADLQPPDRIVRCVQCGLVYADEATGGQELEQAYVEMVDEDYLREEAGRRAQARIVLSRLGRFKTRGRLLDVGCGPGLLLDEARRQNWEVRGVELSRWAHRHATEALGLDVFPGTLAQAGLSDQTFDVVVILDVLEHVPSPRALMLEIGRVLKHDGVVYVSTPNVTSLASRLLRERWWGVNKYHRHYFSPETISKLFSETGLESRRAYSYPRVFSLRYWLRRLEGLHPRSARLLARVAGAVGASDSTFKLYLFDQLDVIARKRRTLELVASERTEAQTPLARRHIVAVLPAYNAAQTLARTVADIPKGSVDDIVLVDDASRDGTVAEAERLGLRVFRHERNRGYGGNQKTCYQQALALGADIVVMVHPDYQYDPRAIPDLIEPIRAGRADAVFGSRMMKGGALDGGMPRWKLNANILLTAFANVVLGIYLTEYHSGFRAYSSRMLRTVAYARNSDNFVFDTEIIVQAVANGFRFEEIPIRTRYFEEASTISLWRSIVYGLGILRVLVSYKLHVWGFWRSRLFKPVRADD